MFYEAQQLISFVSLLTHILFCKHYLQEGTYEENSNTTHHLHLTPSLLTLINFKIMIQNDSSFVKRKFHYITFHM